MLHLSYTLSLPKAFAYRLGAKTIWAFLYPLMHKLQQNSPSSSKTARDKCHKLLMISCELLTVNLEEIASTN